MKLLKKLGLAMGLFITSAIPTFAATDFTTVETALSGEATAIATMALAVAVIGISIFAVRFGVRIAKRVLSSAS